MTTRFREWQYKRRIDAGAEFFVSGPILDPATPEDARKMTHYWFELSEKTRLPVILRPTTRVCHTSGMIELGDSELDAVAGAGVISPAR